MLIAAAHITPAALWTLVGEYTARGPRLHQAACIQERCGEDFAATARELLRRWLFTLEPVPTALRIVLSPELATLVHTFPLEELPQNPEQLTAVLDFELEQFLSDYDRHHYTTFALPLAAPNASHIRAIAMTYPRSELETLRTACAPEIPTELIVPDLFTVAALWRYNYPEFVDRCVLALHLAPPYLDMLVLHHGKPAVLRTARLSGESLPELVASCLEGIDALRQEGEVEAVFAFGVAARREVLEALSEALARNSGSQLECRRLNAFRFWLPPQEQRVREYAIRTAHLFWGCSAACLPVEHELFVL